jgi:hypothetical protein
MRANAAAAPDHHQTHLEETMTQPNHDYIRPGQVAPDRPAPDRCVECGRPEAVHAWPPLDTERQARELPPVRAAWAAWNAGGSRPGTMAPHMHRLLCEALSAAGVELGAFDHRIIWWLAGWEPTTCAVVAGLITRAHAAGSTR